MAGTWSPFCYLGSPMRQEEAWRSHPVLDAGERPEEAEAARS